MSTCQLTQSLYQPWLTPSIVFLHFLYHSKIWYDPHFSVIPKRIDLFYPIGVLNSLKVDIWCVRVVKLISRCTYSENSLIACTKLSWPSFYLWPTTFMLAQKMTKFDWFPIIWYLTTAESKAKIWPAKHIEDCRWSQLALCPKAVVALFVTPFVCVVIYASWREGIGCLILGFLSSLAIISLRKRELIASFKLLYLNCVLFVLWCQCTSVYLPGGEVCLSMIYDCGIIWSYFRSFILLVIQTRHIPASWFTS